MGRPLVTAVAAGLCALGLAACGDGESGSPLDDALGYLPADAPVAAALSTDLESQSYRDLDVALQRFGVPGGVDAALEQLDSGELSFPEDIEPLLGNDVVVGVISQGGVTESEPQYVAATQTADGDELRELLDAVPGLERKEEISGATVYGPEEPEGSEPYEYESAFGPTLAVEGDTLVVAQSEPGLTAALERRDSGEGLTEDAFREHLGGLDDTGLLRVAGDAQSSLEALGIEQTASVPWIGALRSFGAVIDVEGRELIADARLSTDPVDEGDLPIAAGPDSPGLIDRRPSLATADQSQSIRFGLEVAAAALPQAAYEDITRRLERRLGQPLDAVAGHFGEGLIVELPTGETVTRSEVSDPGAVASAVDELRPEILQLVEVASGPVSEFLEPARLLIPILPLPETGGLLAPVPPLGGYFPEGSSITKAPGERALYRVAGPRDLCPAGPCPYVEEFYLGLVDDVFVTAPTLKSARRAADLKPAKLDVPPGSVAFAFPLRGSDVGLSESADVGIVLTTIEGAFEAGSDSVTLRVRAGL